MLSYKTNIFKPLMGLILTLVLLYGIQARRTVYECFDEYICTDEKDYVWATDEERCHVFHNPCLFKIEQCARYNQGRLELFETEKETCRESCEQICSNIFEPVCAQFFEETITFGNECEMRNYLCTEERAYSYYNLGQCADF